MAILSIATKALKVFIEEGDVSGINPNHAPKLLEYCTILDSAKSPNCLVGFGLKIHKLKGDRKDFYSTEVNKNWRLTYKFNENGDVEHVKYEDYHS